MISERTLYLLQNAWPLMLQGAVMTIKVSLVSVIIGAIFGTLFGIANSNKIKVPVLSTLIDGYVLVIRGTPVYVQILICYFGFSLGSPFVAGTIALGLNSIAYVAEIVRTGINSIPSGQWDAAYVLGYSFQGTMFSIILPQMIRNVLPPLTNEFVVLIKETSLLSVIGLVELTRVAKDITARELEPVTIYLAAAAFYLVMTTTVSMFANKLEKGLSYD